MNSLVYSTDQGGGKRPFRAVAALVFAQQLRQLGDIGRDPPHLMGARQTDFSVSLFCGPDILAKL